MRIGEAVDLLDHLLCKRRRYNERRSYSQEVLPAIKMLVGDWYVDELGVLTREITARDYSWSRCRLERQEEPAASVSWEPEPCSKLER